MVIDDYAEWSCRIEYILESRDTGRNGIQKYKGLPSKLVILRPSWWFSVDADSGSYCDHHADVYYVADVSVKKLTLLWGLEWIEGDAVRLCR